MNLREIWLTAVVLGAPAMGLAQTPPEPPTEPAPSTEPIAPADAGPGAEPVPSLAPTEPAAPAAAVDPAAGGGWGDLATIPGDGGSASMFRTKVYGFIDFHLEKVARTPDAVNASGETVYAKNPLEIDIPNLHVMVQGAIQERYRYFLNLASPGSGSNTDDEAIVVRNAWVEAPIVNGYLNVRAGKTYRRFGLYNEILDAVPTFIGIEAPELFDKDHLLLTRTTGIMLHGAVNVGSAVVNYSATTGGDERLDDAFPIGADLNIEWPWGLKVGTSFYHSGDAAPSRAVGDGSPRGGVVNWMSRDSFDVYGGYAQLEHDGLILQAELWEAKHQGERDPAALATLAAEGDLNSTQLARFFENGDPTGAPRLEANYRVRTGYLRGGYEVAIGKQATLTPYAQLDYYSNPETVASKALGGDAEAGITDDGKFLKYTVGAVYRPVSPIALKLDASGHQQEFNGKTEFYPEVRFSISYLWEL